MPLAVNSALPGKLLTDIVCRCVELSRAAAQLPEARRRAALEPLIGQHYRDGNLDLNAIWLALLHEPGVTERALASVFAALEDMVPLLRIGIVPTQRLQKLNQVQRDALLKECPISRTEVERMVRHAKIEESLSGVRISRTSLPPGSSAPPQAEATGLSSTPTATKAAEPPRLTEALQIVPKVALASGPGRGDAPAGAIDGSRQGGPDPLRSATPGAAAPPRPFAPGATDPPRPFAPGAADPPRPFAPGAADPPRPAAPVTADALRAAALRANETSPRSPTLRNEAVLQALAQGSAAGLSKATGQSIGQNGAPALGPLTQTVGQGSGPSIARSEAERRPSMNQAVGTGGPQLVSLPGGRQSLPALPAVILPPSLQNEAQHTGPAEQSGDGAEKESRIKAARELLQRAHAEMLADAVRARPGVAGLATDRPKESSRGKTGAVKAIPKKPRRASRALLIGGGLVFAAALAGGGYYFFLRGPEELDAERIGALRLENLRKSDDRLQGTIQDPRWTKMSNEERKTAVTAVFRQVQKWNIHMVVLSGPEGAMQAQASDEGGALQILLPNSPKADGPKKQP